MTEDFDTEYDDEELILSELPDDKLIKQMHDDLYDGLAEEVAEAIGADAYCRDAATAVEIAKELLAATSTPSV